jgi:hypothetical protein
LHPLNITVFLLHTCAMGKRIVSTSQMKLTVPSFILCVHQSSSIALTLEFAFLLLGYATEVQTVNMVKTRIVQYAIVSPSLPVHCYH